MKHQFLFLTFLAAFFACSYTVTPDPPTAKIIETFQAAFDCPAQNRGVIINGEKHRVALEDGIWKLRQVLDSVPQGYFALPNGFTPHLTLEHTPNTLFEGNADFFLSPLHYENITDSIEAIPTVNWTFVQVTYEVEQAVTAPAACCSGYKTKYLYAYPKEFPIVGNDKPTLAKAAKLVPIPLKGKKYKAVSFEVLRVEKRPVPPTTPIEREKE